MPTSIGNLGTGVYIIGAGNNRILCTNSTGGLSQLSSPADNTYLKYTSGGTYAFSTIDKTTVGLSNVTNDEQMPKSGGSFSGPITATVINAAIRTNTITTATDGATVTFDLSVSDNHIVTLGGNRTLALSNAPTSSPWRRFTIILKQDGTGSRTVVWFSGISWDDGTVPQLTQTANKSSVFVFYQTGSGTYLGFMVGRNM